MNQTKPVRWWRASIEMREENAVLEDPTIGVVSQTRHSPLSSMALYAGRPDKSYSLTDCISMQLMRELAIFEVLTHDHHFA